VDPTPSIDALRTRLRRFAEARDWDRFHSPKNLAMALAAEAGELLDHFRWLTEEESASLPPETRAEVEDEIADVLIFLVRLCDKLGIEPLAAAGEKIERNERRYPVAASYGRATKHDRL